MPIQTGRRFSRADELCLIAAYIAEHGVTCCPPRCCVHCSAFTESARIAMVMAFEPPPAQRHIGQQIAERWLAENLAPGVHWIDAAVLCREATHVSWRAIVAAYRRLVAANALACVGTGQQQTNNRACE
jgi:hypothetical protein